MIWAGAILTILGLTGIVYSIVLVSRAKRANLDDQALRERLSKVLPINLAALLASALGLMIVIIGIVLA